MNCPNWRFVVFLLFLGLPKAGLAQIVIGGSEPDSSAQLDIQSTSRGFLIPRLTQEQKDSIEAPAQGLQLFNVTTGCLEANVGVPEDPVWVNLGACRGRVEALQCDGVSTDVGLGVSVSAMNRILRVPYEGGNGGVYSGRILQSYGVEGVVATLTAGSFLVGSGELEFALNGTPKESGTALFQLSIGGNSCEISIPIDSGSVEYLTCDSGSDLVSGVLIADEPIDSVSVMVNYSGGNGGPYAGNTFFSREGHNISATYDDGFLQIGAGFLEVSLTGLPDTVGFTTFEIEIGNQNCILQVAVYERCTSDAFTDIVDVVNPLTGFTWMDRNLGATRQAEAIQDEESYGYLYQWGRLTDGHQCRYSPLNDIPATTDEPGHGDFISIFQWRFPQNDSLWQGLNGINNPCPSGYRLPTAAEWELERQSWEESHILGAFNSPLKLPATGYRFFSGNHLKVGEEGNYWSSSSAGDKVVSLSLGNEYSYENSYRGLGLSVRCIKH